MCDQDIHNARAYHDWKSASAKAEVAELEAGELWLGPLLDPARLLSLSFSAVS